MYNGIPSTQKIIFFQLLLVGMLCMLVLAGWTFDLTLLRKGIASSVDMNPLTSVTFLIALAALLFYTWERPGYKGYVIFLGMVTAFIGFFRLGEIVLGWQTNISWIFFAKQIMKAEVGTQTNVMAPNTAFAFSALGMAIATSKISSRALKYLPDVFAIMTWMISLLSLIGYIYQAPEFFAVNSYIPMALPTAICFFILSITTLILNSRMRVSSLFWTTYPGSRIARLLLPIIFVMVIAFGKLRLYGESSLLFSSAFGTSLFTFISLVLYLVIIGIIASELNSAAREIITQVKRTKEIQREIQLNNQKAFEKSMALAQAEQQKKVLEASIEGSEQEKKQIGMELHDHVNQILSSTRLYAEMAMVEENNKNLLLEKCIQQLTFAISEIRKLSRAMVLQKGDAEGIYLQVNELVMNFMETTRLRVDMKINSLDINSFPYKHQIALFRILEEQFNNISKHAQASLVEVTFRRVDKGYELMVSDNGIGFNPAASRPGIGLANIQNRVNLLNGNLEIDAAPGKGSKLTITVHDAI